jgi:hypothetical protein
MDEGSLHSAIWICWDEVAFLQFTVSRHGLERRLGDGCDVRIEAVFLTVRPVSLLNGLHRYPSSVTALDLSDTVHIY